MSEHDEAIANWYGDDAATLGDRLTAAREDAGLTPDALAGRVGVSTDTVASWEADMSEPRANRLSMLAGVLNVSLRWLLTGDGQGVDEPSEAESGLPRSDVSALLAEIRLLRGEAERTAARLEVLEARLEAATRAA
ncbi:MAG: helix-turn-helix domain-containing protein [Paracoccaceae bacterium]|nr:helix-turn-helix domain-containing protein [Paracoccaceae bacterium]